VLSGRAQAALLETSEEGAHGEYAGLGAGLEEPLELPEIGAEGLRGAAGELLGEEKSVDGVGEGVSRGFFCG
jgi:hypothetical protein